LRLDGEGGEALEDIGEDADGGLGGVDGFDEVRRVELEGLEGFGFVSLEAALDDLDIGVVEAIFFEGAALHTLDEFGGVVAGEVKDDEDVEGGGEDFGLRAVTGESIEDEEMAVGVKGAGLGFGEEIIAPEADGEFVGDEFTFAGVFEEGVTEFGFGAESAEDVAAGAVVIARDGAEDFALGTFAGARGAEEEDGIVSGGGVGFRLWRLCVGG
jgi:hypothetical protein